MNWIFSSLKKLRKHDFHFWNLEKALKVQKASIYLSASLKKLKKQRFNFLQVWKSSKSRQFIFCKPKKLKTHESNFYEAVKLSKSLKTASKDPVLVPGKCSSFWTESGRHQFPDTVQSLSNMIRSLRPKFIL